MAEMIDITQDDDLQSKSRLVNRKKCLNPDCTSLDATARASQGIKRFYGLDNSKKKRICSKCKMKAESHLTSAAGMVRSGNLVLSKNFPLNPKSYFCMDSNSDSSDEDTSGEDTEFEYDIFDIKKQATSNHPKRTNSLSELKDVIEEIFVDLDLKRQLVDGCNNINSRLLQAEDGFKELNTDFDLISDKLEVMYRNFYSTFLPETQYLPSIDIGEETPPPICEETKLLQEVTICPKSLPPFGALQRPKLNVKDKVYCMRQSVLHSWVAGYILKIGKTSKGKLMYTVCYKRANGKLIEKIVNGYELAYYTDSPTRLQVGTRIIAKYEDDIQQTIDSGQYYVGIIAEVPSHINKYRYLIFFDDGYAQYAPHKDIRIVTESSAEVWKDIGEESREFIKDYLLTYPERPMARLQKYNFIKTERNGKWWKAQVLEVDASLVKMHFILEKEKEWLYRGSTRFAPLFKKKETLKSNNFVRRRTLPYNRSNLVEYINFSQKEEQEKEKILNQLCDTSTPSEDHVEEDSISQKRQREIDSEELSKRISLEAKGSTLRKDLIEVLPRFYPHQCLERCLRKVKKETKAASPLVRPILEGWCRQIAIKKGKSSTQSIAFYIAPCGRRLRSIEEVFLYLRHTQSQHDISSFTFDVTIDLVRTWSPDSKLVEIKDVTSGKEGIPIPCINSIDHEKPVFQHYSKYRNPAPGISLNTDSGFLVCCDCDDDCQDKERCDCWQLTIEGAKLLTKNQSSIGYSYKRLLEQVLTGVFECNSFCKCRNSCLNRVVQLPLTNKLQLFKTAQRGWGVRTLNDIPKGSFICTYVGNIMTEAEANIEGMEDGGDDYYAELDFIEMVEKVKEGYESDVEEEIEDEKSFIDDSNSTNWLKGKAKAFKNLVGNAEKHSGRNSSLHKISSKDKKKKKKKIPKSLRKYFRNQDRVYILDAKTKGNIGRYLNHSCNSNVFVQNVFVDTHDPRFPWIAFFASVNIAAGTELTWDYNYEVGSVPGKVKYCYCRSTNCKGRLL